MPKSQAARDFERRAEGCRFLDRKEGRLARIIDNPTRNGSLIYCILTFVLFDPQP